MASYRRFLRVLEKWPIQKERGERDLGFLLRKQLTEKFPGGEGAKVNEAAWSKHLDSLERIASNQHLSKHPLPKGFLSATGLSADECRAALSEEFLHALQEENSGGLFKKIFRSRSKK